MKPIEREVEKWPEQLNSKKDYQYDKLKELLKEEVEDEVKEKEEEEMENEEFAWIARAEAQLGSGVGQASTSLGMFWFMLFVANQRVFVA